MPQPNVLSQPARDVSTVETPDGLPVPRGKVPPPKFVYVTYPRSWSWAGPEHGFLPDLKRVVAKPGCNGVGEDLDMSRVLAGVSSKGGTYIRPGDERLGEFADYVRYYTTRDGRRWYVDFCEVATVLPNGEVLWDTGEEVQAQWLAFRAAVRDSGIISPMLVQVYEGLHARQRRTVDDLGARIHSNPQLTHKYEEAVQTLADMEAAWSANSAELAKKAKAKKPKATTKKKRTRKPKPKLTPPAAEEAAANG